MNRASTDLWGAWVGNHPGLPGLRQASSGKEEESRTRKPFVATLRVQIPPGRAWPGGRKRVLRGEGRPSLRSVDSESQCRAIEPRNLCSWEPPLLTQAGAVSETLQWPGVFGPAGVQEQGEGA